MIIAVPRVKQNIKSAIDYKESREMPSLYILFIGPGTTSKYYAN